jgi:8-oxo-dGTP diphosphatase
VKPKFCSQCAGPLEWRRLEDERHPQPVCTRCGHVEWQNPKPTASAVITRRLPDRTVEVLLTRRARPPFEDYWDVPGGFIDPDEHPDDALRRELTEELGVQIDIDGFLGIFMDTYGDGGESTLNIFYLATLRKGTISPGSDVKEARWFPLARLPEQIAFTNGRQALTALATTLRDQRR